MLQTNKIFPLLTAFLLGMAAAGPAFARDGTEIAKIFDSGVAAYDAGQYEQAFKIWWDLRYEDLAAMRNLAMMLRKGQGVARDPKQAEEIYQRAAEAGLPTAQADLADMLLKGEAGPPDLAGALPLLEAAAAAIIRSPSSSWVSSMRPARPPWCHRIWRWPVFLMGSESG